MADGVQNSYQSGENAEGERFIFTEESPNVAKLYDEKTDTTFRLEKGVGGKRGNYVVTEVTNGLTEVSISMERQSIALVQDTQNIVTRMAGADTGRMTLMRNDGSAVEVTWSGRDRFVREHGAGVTPRTKGKHTIIQDVDNVIAKVAENTALGRPPTATIRADEWVDGKKVRTVVEEWTWKSTKNPDGSYSIDVYHGERVVK